MLNTTRQSRLPVRLFRLRLRRVGDDAAGYRHRQAMERMLPARSNGAASGFSVPTMPRMTGPGHEPTDTADRVAMVEMSPIGTFQTCRPVLPMSVLRLRPEVVGLSAN